MNGADWEEVVCLLVVAVCCGFVIWYLLRGGW